MTIDYLYKLRRLKKPLKIGLMRLAPDLALTVLSMRARRFIERQARGLGLVELTRRVAEATGSTVSAGPFAGMALDVDALPVHAAPKFLGTYERELHQVIERAVARRPRRVVNVGAAEGYYAVGLARRLPDAKIYAFDADPKARRATMINAHLNGVGARVRAQGILHLPALEEFLHNDRSMIVMDCEGAELDLLDPSAAPSLCRADIVVELHPDMRPEVETVISSRFTATHSIERINPAKSDTKLAIAATATLSEADRRAAVDERRGKTLWFYLESVASR
jgi:hypothetical protein